MQIPMHKFNMKIVCNVTLFYTFLESHTSICMINIHRLIGESCRKKAPLKLAKFTRGKKDDTVVHSYLRGKQIFHGRAVCVCHNGSFGVVLAPLEQGIIYKNNGNSNSSTSALLSTNY